jgi:hypothetical protein
LDDNNIRFRLTVSGRDRLLGIHIPTWSQNLSQCLSGQLGYDAMTRVLWHLSDKPPFQQLDWIIFRQDASLNHGVILLYA